MLPPRSSVYAVCFVLSALALSGCTTASEPTSSTPQDVQGVKDLGGFDGESGAVQGIVLSEDSVPVEEASVILGAAATLTVDATGSFQFREVPPGTYTLTAHAQGYEAQSRSITVNSGETTEVRFKLPPAPSDAPYHETMIVNGHICAAMNLAGVFISMSFLCTGADEGIVFIPFSVNRGLDTIVAELEWMPTSGLTSETLMLRICHGGSRSGTLTCDYTYGEAEGRSPVYVLHDGPFEGVENAENDNDTIVDGYVRVPQSESNAGLANIVFDQRVTLYASVFYGENAPEGFTARADQ